MEQCIYLMDLNELNKAWNMAFKLGAFKTCEAIVTEQYRRIDLARQEAPDAPSQAA